MLQLDWRALLHGLSHREETLCPLRRDTNDRREHSLEITRCAWSHARSCATMTERDCAVPAGRSAQPRQLLNFAEAIAISRRSPERFLRILDMYEGHFQDLDE